MKILFVTNDFAQFRGTQRMMLETAKSFATDHEIAAWCFDNGGETEDFFKASGIKTFSGMENIERMLAFRPDIVNIHRGGCENKRWSEIIGRFRGNGAKIIETSVFGWVDYHSDKYIDLSLQISRWDLKRWLMRKGPFTRTLGTYLPYLVDTDSFVRSDDKEIEIYKSTHGIPKDAFVIGRAGKTAWDIVTPQILKVLEENSSAHFLSVSDYCGTNMPKELEANPKVHIVPRCYSNAELSKFYSSCSVFLSASGIGESFGMVVGEALSCQVPVIGWATPQIDNAQAELVHHGEGGWMIKTLEELPRLIKTLIHPSEGTYDLSAVGKIARESIIRRYSRPVVELMLKKAFAAVAEATSRKELAKRLKAEGFDLDVPKHEFQGYINNAIGRYPPSVKLWQAINTSYTLQKLYALYNFILGRKTP